MSPRPTRRAGRARGRPGARAAALAGLLLAALAAPAVAQPTLDASRIRLDTFSYSVRFEGEELGTLQVSYTRTGEGNLRVREAVAGVLGNEETSYEMTPDLRPRSARRTGRLARVSADLDLTYREGRVSGHATVRADSAGPGRGPAGTRRIEVDRELPAETLDPNMVVAALLASGLAEGDTVRYPIFRPGRGVVEARARVAGTDSVEVPAGRFAAYRVELSTDQGRFTLWMTRETPRMLVRQVFRERPVEVELRSVGAPAGADAAADTASPAGGGSGTSGRWPGARSRDARRRQATVVSAVAARRSPAACPSREPPRTARSSRQSR